MNKKLAPSLLTAFMLLACLSTAQADDAVSPIPKVADEWRFSVTPYAWVPQVNTTVSSGSGGSKNADLSIHTLVNNLKSGGMITGDAHYGKWGGSLDYASATLQKNGGFSFQSNPGYRFSDKATLQATLVNLVGTYTVLNNENAFVDATVGARWVGITTTFDVTLMGTSDTSGAASVMQATYGVVGTNSRYRIMDSNWYIPFTADIGTAGGPNHATWQGSLGVGVALSKNVDMSLAYRAIGFELKSGADTLLKGIFHGPQFTTTINF